MNVLDTRTSGQEIWIRDAWAEIRTSARTLATGPLRLEGDTHSADCKFPHWTPCSCPASNHARREMVKSSARQ